MLTAGQVRLNIDSAGIDLDSGVVGGSAIRATMDIQAKARWLAFLNGAAVARWSGGSPPTRPSECADSSWAITALTTDLGTGTIWCVRTISNHYGYFAVREINYQSDRRRMDWIIIDYRMWE